MTPFISAPIISLTPNLNYDFTFFHFYPANNFQKYLFQHVDGQTERKGKLYQEVCHEKASVKDQPWNVTTLISTLVISLNDQRLLQLFFLQPFHFQPNLSNISNILSNMPPEYFL